MTCNFRPRDFSKTIYRILGNICQPHLQASPLHPCPPSSLSSRGKTTYWEEGGGLIVPLPARGLSCLHMPAPQSPVNFNSPLHTQAPNFWTKARLAPLGTSSQRELHQATPHLQVSPVLTSHRSGEEAGLGPMERGGDSDTHHGCPHPLHLQDTGAPSLPGELGSCGSEERQS